MDIRAPLFAAVIVVAWFLCWHWCRHQESRRRFHLVQKVREDIRTSGMASSLQTQSRPYRVDLWTSLQYPPGTMTECRDRSEPWRVVVHV